MQKNNLFIVESPLQLISAIEAINYFGGDYTLIVKYNNEKSNQNQIEEILKVFKINKKIEIYPYISNFDANIQLLILLKKFIKKKIYFDRVFIGEYRSFHMRKFFDQYHKSESFCLDDGNITFEIVKFIKQEKDLYYYEHGLKGRVKKLIYKLQSIMFGCEKLKIKRNIRLFTCCDINDIEICILHNFNNIKRLNNVKKINEVYFYGTNLQLLNISIEEELEYIKKVFNFFQEKELNLIYFPHRKESEYKLSLISEKFDIECRKSKLPAEIQLLVDGFIPTNIVSFGSSVLITLPILFEEIENVYGFFPDISKISNTYQEEWNTMKEYYKLKMDVIELNELS